MMLLPHPLNWFEISQLTLLIQPHPLQTLVVVSCRDIHMKIAQFSMATRHIEPEVMIH